MPIPSFLCKKYPKNVDIKPTLIVDRYVKKKHFAWPDTPEANALFERWWKSGGRNMGSKPFPLFMLGHDYVRLRLSDGSYIGFVDGGIEINYNWERSRWSNKVDRELYEYLFKIVHSQKPVWVEDIWKEN